MRPLLENSPIPFRTANRFILLNTAVAVGGWGPILNVGQTGGGVLRASKEVLLAAASKLLLALFSKLLLTAAIFGLNLSNSMRLS